MATQKAGTTKSTEPVGESTYQAEEKKWKSSKQLTFDTGQHPSKCKCNPCQAPANGLMPPPPLHPKQSKGVVADQHYLEFNLTLNYT